MELHLIDEFWEELRKDNPEIAHRLVAGHLQIQLKLVIEISSTHFRKSSFALRVLANLCNRFTIAVWWVVTRIPAYSF